MKSGQSLLLLVGPEGGLTDEEIKLLEKNGFALCGLGPRILRRKQPRFTCYLLFPIILNY